VLRSTARHVALLASGNLVFRGGTAKGPALERFLETEAVKRVKLDTDCFVRSATEWDAVVAQNPFPAEAELAALVRV